MLTKTSGTARKHFAVARNQSKEIGGIMLRFLWSEEEQRHGRITGVSQFLLFPETCKRRVVPLITVQPRPTLNTEFLRV
jgi:hypothetical protein